MISSTLNCRPRKKKLGKNVLATGDYKLYTKFQISKIIIN